MCVLRSWSMFRVWIEPRLSSHLYTDDGLENAVMITKLGVIFHDRVVRCLVFENSVAGSKNMIAKLVNSMWHMPKFSHIRLGLGIGLRQEDIS